MEEKMRLIFSFLILLVSLAMSSQATKFFGSASINENFGAELFQKNYRNTVSNKTSNLIQTEIINGTVVVPKIIYKLLKSQYDLLSSEKLNANLKKILDANNFDKNLELYFHKFIISPLHQKVILNNKSINFDSALRLGALINSNFLIGEDVKIKYFPKINPDYSFQIKSNKEITDDSFNTFNIKRDGDYEIQKYLTLFFDSKNKDIANSINVFEELLSGAKISVEFLTNFFTVRERLDTAKEVAKSIANDVKLLYISTSEGPNFIFPDTIYNGRVSYAQYQFYSPIQNLSINVFVSPFGVNFFTIEDTLDYYVEVPMNFLDSDSIFSICENNGGSSFRRKFPDATLLYEIGKVNEPPTGIDTTQVYWVVGYTNQSFTEALLFIINPLTGFIVYKSEFSLTQITAKERLSLVDSLAKSYSIDANLTYVILVDYGFEFLMDDTIDGRGLFLSFGYKSPTKDKFSVHYLLGNTVIDSTGWLLPFNIHKPLTNINQYLDSPTIAELAEIHGGYAFRTDSVDILNSVAYYLGQSPFLAGPIDTSQIYWIADYTGSKFDDSLSTQRELLLFFNPLNGAFVGNLILTNISKDEFVITPSKFKLHQNYPNPFNTKTTISYELPERSKVKITVYNLIGQEIITLVDREQDSGKYYINFDASGLPSGVYFYRIEAGKFVEVKKMTFIK